MLPFLKAQRKSDGIATVYRAPDEEKASKDEGLAAAARDLMKGIHSADEKLVMSAIRAAFEILDAEPHREGPHLDESEGQE